MLWGYHLGEVQRPGRLPEEVVSKLSSESTKCRGVGRRRGPGTDLLWVPGPKSLLDLKGISKLASCLFPSSLFLNASLCKEVGAWTLASWALGCCG